MKTRLFAIFIGGLCVLTMNMCGCSGRPQPPINKATFGYVGMKLPKNYNQMMNQIQANNAKIAQQHVAQMNLPKPNPQ